MLKNGTPTFLEETLRHIDPTLVPEMKTLLPREKKKFFQEDVQMAFHELIETKQFATADDRKAAELLRTSDIDFERIEVACVCVLRRMERQVLNFFAFCSAARI